MEWLKSNMKARIDRWTAGTTPLPGRYIFGAPCLNDHARNGKTVRYKCNTACVLCDSSRRKKEIAKKQGGRDLTAVHAFEERANQEDEDPLF